MKAVSDALKAHMRGDVTSLCTCISITRRDKATFGFTDHDEELLINNQRYLPFNSFSRTSISNSGELEVDGLEINGILNSDAFARQDIGGGLFDFSEVDVFLINWADVTMGSMSLRRGWLGEIEMNEDSTFHGEVRGLSQVYTYKLGRPFAAECDADLGDNRCRFNLDPDFWKGMTPYRAGDAALAHIVTPTHFVNAQMTNAHLTDDPDGTTERNVTGWVTYGDLDGRWAIAGSSFHGLGLPPQGGQIAGLVNTIGTNDTGDLGMYQDVDLVASGLTTGDIDTGLCFCALDAYVAVVEDNGRVQMRLTALDANGVPKNIWDSGEHAYGLLRWVTLRTTSTLIPAGTRKIRVDFHGHKDSSASFGAVFGGCNLVFNDPNGTFGGDGQSDGVLFVATTGGVTGGTEPAFTNTVGATYTDGTVTWVCKASVKEEANVSAVTSNQVFDAPLLQDDGYYDGGLLVWETGANLGRNMQVHTWLGGHITLFQRTFVPIQVGDRFVVHPGCDKTRATCVEKFDIVVNFRGFPDVPGIDAYLQTPTVPTQ